MVASANGSAIVGLEEQPYKWSQRWSEDPPPGTTVNIGNRVRRDLYRKRGLADGQSAQRRLLTPDRGSLFAVDQAMGPCHLMSKQRGSEMHRKLAIFTVLAVLGVIGAGSAVAGQPADPGCFGEDRSTNIHDVARAGRKKKYPGASEWGALAAQPRRRTNGG